MEKFPADFDVHLQLKVIDLECWCTRIGFLQVRITGTKNRKQEALDFAISTYLFMKKWSILMSFFCFLVIPNLESEKCTFLSIEHRIYFKSNN